MVEVRLPSSLVALFPGTARRMTCPDAATVLALIEALDAEYPGLRDRLCAPGPVRRPYINLYVDGEPAELDSQLHADATVHILPAVAGGAGRDGRESPARRVDLFPGLAARFAG
jgi:molybdopterin converting factor small subunit